MYNVIDPQVEGHDVSRVGLADVSRYRLDHVVGLGPGEVLASPGVPERRPLVQLVEPRPLVGAGDHPQGAGIRSHGLKLDGELDAGPLV